MLHIGIYSQRPDVLQSLRQAVQDFIDTAYLDLNLLAYDDLQALMRDLTVSPLEVLLYDTETAEELEREVWAVMRTIPTCTLILLGNDTRHALFGYAVRAAEYLLTPLDPEDLIATLARLLRQRLDAKDQFLPLKINGIWSRLNMRHIVYLESVGHNMVFHMNDGKDFRMVASFKDYQSLLTLNRHYFRCHKSYAVNMQYVDDLEQTCLRLKDGRTINISRPYRQIARSFYASYITEQYEHPRSDGSMLKQAPPSKAAKPLEASPTDNSTKNSRRM